MNVQMMPLERIRPYPKNARTHPPAQIAMLAALIKKFGPDQPIVVDEKFVILKGHGRRLASLEAGLSEFPVVVQADLSETDKAAMRISDNQSALLSGWDIALLRDNAAELKAAGYDMPLLGFGETMTGWLTAGEMVSDVNAEWAGMPQFQQGDQTAFRSIVVHFKDQAAVDLFAKVTKQAINDKTRFLWYPNIEIKPFVKVVSR
jgi:ParB-like nuclease family protein